MATSAQEWACTACNCRSNWASRINCRWCGADRPGRQNEGNVKYFVDKKRPQRQRAELPAGTPPPLLGAWVKHQPPRPADAPATNVTAESSIGDRISALARQVQQLKQWDVDESAIQKKEDEIARLRVQRDASKPLSVLLRQAEARQQKAESKRDRHRKQLDDVRSQIAKLHAEEAKAQQLVTDAEQEIVLAKQEAIDLKAERPPESEAQKATEAVKLLDQLGALLASSAAAEHLRPLQEACTLERDRLAAAQREQQQQQDHEQSEQQPAAAAAQSQQSAPTSASGPMDWEQIAAEVLAQAQAQSADEAKQTLAKRLAEASATQPVKAQRTG